MCLFHEFKYCLLISLIPVGSLIAQTPIDSEAEAVSYAEALQRAIAADPRLELNTTLAKAAEGQIEQADLRPNPVVGAELENILGTGPFNGVDGLELTLGISQVIETADKRARRTELARAERALVDWEREAIRAEIETLVRSAFVNVLLAHELVGLRKEQLALAERSAQETAVLVKAARSPQVEQTRAQLAVRQQQFAAQRAGRDLATAKTMLASLWGEFGDTDFSAVGGICLENATPAFPELVAKLADSVVLARYSAEERTRETALDLEQARARPDVEVFAGGRYFNQDDGDVGLVAGVSMPWPLFDKNQGNIRTARARLRAVWQERDVVRRKLLIALNRAYQQVLSAQEEADMLQSELLPAAEATLRDTETGYEMGQFNQLAVLESRSALFQVREAYLEALQRYALAQAKIEALTRPAQISPGF